MRSPPQTEGPASQFKENPVAVALWSETNLTYPVFPVVLKIADVSCEKQIDAINGSDALDPSLKKQVKQLIFGSDALGDHLMEDAKRHALGFPTTQFLDKN